MQKRRGLIVWVYSLRQLKNLRRFGFVHYVSRKMKYVVMYLNEEEYESKKTKIILLTGLHHLCIKSKGSSIFPYIFTAVRDR